MTTPKSIDAHLHDGDDDDHGDHDEAGDGVRGGDRGEAGGGVHCLYIKWSRSKEERKGGTKWDGDKFQFQYLRDTTK